MRIQKIIVSERKLKAALARIKKEYGNDVTVNIRNYRKYFFFGPKMTEITLFIDEESLRRRKAAPPPREKKDPWEKSKTVVQSIKSTIEKLEVKDEAYPPVLRRYIKLMRAHEVSSEIINFLVEETYHSLPPESVSDTKAVERRFVKSIQKAVRFTKVLPSVTSKPRVIAFIGPTGVGKTTTLAKIAAKFRIENEMNVGIVTVDTYRIAADKQLRIIASIMDAPFEVIYTPKEFALVLEKFKKHPLVFLDTAGRSPKNFAQIKDLIPFLEHVAPDNVYLVLDVSKTLKDLRRTVQNFAEHLRFSNIIFTKLDETYTYGNILNVAFAFKKNLSYFTTGQNIPNDIVEATPEVVFKLITGEIEYGGSS